MTDVLFYHLEHSALEQVLPSLLEKSRARGWRCLVHAGSEDRAEAIDAQLWTYRDESWLPHGRETDAATAPRQPILVTVTGENANDAQVRFAVDGAPLGALDGLERCVFMFNGRDDTAVADARQAWKAAKASGHAVTYWQQDSDGRWVKKAG